MDAMYDAGWDLRSSDSYKAMALRSLVSKSSDDLFRIICVAASGTSALTMVKRLERFNVAKEIGLPQRVIDEVLGEYIEKLEGSDRYYLVLMECMFCVALLRNGELLDNVADHGPFMLKQAAEAVRKENNEAVRIRTTYSGIFDPVRE